MILAGDVGGTKTLLALFDAGLRTIVERRYASRDHASLESILEAFVAENGARVEAAAFGVAGPVRDGRCRTTNLPWEVDARDLAARLGLARAGLVNDLEANAWGLAALAPESVHGLRAGTPDPAGNQALIAAGTGLGEAGLLFTEAGLRPFATEGGHAGLAPRTEREMDLLRFLMQRKRPVSWEHVLSGPGLVNVYRFARQASGEAEPLWLTEALAAGDPAAAVSDAALHGRDAACVRTLDDFCGLYGSEARNLALKVLATGGVWLGGGIAPRILSFLERRPFIEAFLDAGPMTRLLEAVPVRVALEPRTALLGAARLALA